MQLWLSDKIRQAAFLKARRLEVARESVETLTDDECLIIYAEIEVRLSRTTKPKLSDKHCKMCGNVGHNRRTCSELKAKKEPAKSKYTDRILEILVENSHGLRTYEIAQKTDQTLPNAFGTLKLLERQRRVERHGKRCNTLWTLPGVSPVPRIETIPAAIIDVLSKAKAPMDSRCLRDEVEKVLVQNIGKRPTDASLTSGLGRLIENGVVALHGANERGALYVLVTPKGGAANPPLN